MKILWFTWKDRKHPQSGGAEVVNEELSKRLARDGHEVVFVVAGFPGGAAEETIDGFKIIRVGNRYSVYWWAYRHYKKHLQGWADVVIDEMNTMPFFASWYVKEPCVMFAHQLCREVWFHQSPFPMSVIGYLFEPVYVRLLNKNSVITISESTKQDLLRFGFKDAAVRIISQGIEIDPAESLEHIQKYDKPTMLSLGAFREMKRTKHQIAAFEIAKKNVPDLRMKLAGNSSGNYGIETLRMIEKSPYREDIEYLGRVSREQKVELMQKSHCITVTSVKEGWGLIVTEANSQGTPAVGYDVDGLRDSIRNNETGLLSISNTPESLAIAIETLLQHPDRYDIMRQKAWMWSKEITFEKSYRDFLDILRKDETA
jgi:glycosyltransferase involved in cell wall biosynthesis